MKKILAIMQNQWFREPERVETLMGNRPEIRNHLIGRFLFASGCLSGRRLRQAFGPLVDHIIWEEASPKVGGHSASVFPADRAHLAAAIARHSPELILCFGKIAGDAIRSMALAGEISFEIAILYGPHPASRTENPISKLSRMADQTRGLLDGAWTQAGHGTF